MIQMLEAKILQVLQHICTCCLIKRLFIVQHFSVPGLSTALAYSFALQANDTALKDFTLAILRLSENDFLDQLKREWWELTNECLQKRGTSEKTFL